MAYLITKHDPFHVHKILGIFVLLHFLYRLALVVNTGYGFRSEELGEEHSSPWGEVAPLLVHGLLSTSSIVFRLPSKRNFSSPMIWPEFRLHSIIFAMRHIVLTGISLLKLWPQHIVFNIFLKVIIVCATVGSARIVTRKLGDKENRTTNSMPYPDSVTLQEEKVIKKLYAQAQFHAVGQSMLGDATSAFLPLLGIQIAPFLMTLVRKGKIGSKWYHRVYAFALWLPFAVALVRFMHGTLSFAEVSIMGFASRYIALELRINKGFSQEKAWTVALLFSMLLMHQTPVCAYVDELFKSNHMFRYAALSVYAVLGPGWDKRGYLPLTRSTGQTVVPSVAQVSDKDNKVSK